jgi:hypothetical protein
MIDRAIKRLCPQAEFVIENNDYTTIRWIVEPESIPTLEQIQAEIAVISEETQKLQYKSLRKAEYPSIGDQLDALYHAGLFPQEMADKIAAVKLKYPKE